MHFLWQILLYQISCRYRKVIELDRSSEQQFQIYYLELGLNLYTVDRITIETYFPSVCLCCCLSCRVPGSTKENSSANLSVRRRPTRQILSDRDTVNNSSKKFNFTWFETHQKIMHSLYLYITKTIPDITVRRKKEGFSVQILSWDSRNKIFTFSMRIESQVHNPKPIPSS